MTPETLGYVVGVAVGAWAWYRIGKYAYGKLRA